MGLKNKKSAFALSDLVNFAIDDLGIRHEINEAQAVEAWHALAGPMIAKVTERVWTQRGKMYVELNSGTWRQELHMHRVQWRERLNQTLGKRIIHEIIFQ